MGAGIQSSDPCPQSERTSGAFNAAAKLNETITSDYEL